MRKLLSKQTFCVLLLISALLLSFTSFAKQDFYQLKIFHLKDDSQVQRVDAYLKDAYLPALHRSGIKSIGVFKPISNDTAAEKFVYVLIPFSTVDEWMKLDNKLKEDAAYKSAAKNFNEADAANSPYTRIESILLEAFTGQPHLLLPSLKNADRIFELRSYESPTQRLHEKKMAMFNTGGEIEIFNRLGFNPVFYGRVLSGSRMPNFMYMPIFKNIEDKNAQWKVFGNDPKWKEISALPENENKVAVSHIDSILMHSTDYSDY
jgi:hypothetical protein